MQLARSARRSATCRKSFLLGVVFCAPLVHNGYMVNGAHTKGAHTMFTASERIREARKARGLTNHNLATIAVVQSGKCPLCGSKIRRNLALTGWYQCEQYGDGHFRARPDEPKCSWQGFTE